jgi:hypothetical protein
MSKRRILICTANAAPRGSERESRFLESIPLHRVGTPAEIAHVICFRSFG